MMKNPLPREIVPGVFWLGQCLEQHFQGKVYHAYNAAFLIIGSESSLLVETGHPGDFAEINRQVKDIVLPKESKWFALRIAEQPALKAAGWAGIGCLFAFQICFKSDHLAPACAAEIVAKPTRAGQVALCWGQGEPRSTSLSNFD